MWTFLNPFWEDTTILDQGIVCESPNHGTFMCRAFLLCGTADLPARCILCNCIQYNGSYSCWKCHLQGESTNVGKGHAHVFPYDEGNPKGPPRTAENVLSDAREALRQQQSGKPNAVVYGVKGPSSMFLVDVFPRFDIVPGVAIDLHAWRSFGGPEITTQTVV